MNTIVSWGSNFIKDSLDDGDEYECELLVFVSFELLCFLDCGFEPGGTVKLGHGSSVTRVMDAVRMRSSSATPSVWMERSG